MATRAMMRETRLFDASADHGTTRAYRDGIMSRKQLAQIAELESHIAWWRKIATQWQGVNEVELARCMRIVDRAFDDIGRIEAGIEVAS
jgi:hypothetical protein